ncbi:hypothetical protein PMI16_00332 [Herbaspirillum sp. CF444]|nr:hypothetical protein PMI16_00332 [Herbaspirillum sp. CF444]
MPACCRLWRTTASPRSIPQSDSEQARTVRHRLIGREQHHFSLCIGESQRQHFRHELADLPRRKVDHGRHLPAHQLIRLIVRRDLRAALLDADGRTEVDFQLAGRFAGFREGFGGDDRADISTLRKSSKPIGAAAGALESCSRCMGCTQKNKRRCKAVQPLFSCGSPALRRS